MDLFGRKSDHLSQHKIHLPISPLVPMPIELRIKMNLVLSKKITDFMIDLNKLNRIKLQLIFPLSNYGTEIIKSFLCQISWTKQS